MRRFFLLTAALLLAACQTTPKDYIQFHAGTDAPTVAKHISDMVGMCWFDGKHKAFADYSYSPEPNFASSRVLIVPKAGPHGLPALIVEIDKAKRGTDVKLFGPLMQSDSANAIRSDIMRWTGGAREC